MRTTIKQIICAPALLLLAAMLGMAGCAEDDTFGRLSEGSIPLEVGDVTVAGMKTNTRAAISENANGYTGIRKSTFANGDVLNLTLSNDGDITNTPVTATLTAGKWVLNKTTYVISGTTTIKAAYTATAQAAGIKPDALEANNYTFTGQKVSFDMRHANAMIDITLPAGVTMTGITVAANNGTADETLTTVAEEEADGTMHYRTIALPGTVKSLTATINGQSYMATLATPLIVKANKKYPVALTFEEYKLTASVGTAALDWGIGGTNDAIPTGYTRIIGTPEDLAQFAYDVNNNLNDARTAKVFQTANIDLAQLKTAADANIANPDKNYTYTATAENWVPIANAQFNADGTPDFSFSGTYNGNGHTVSNMKITDNPNEGGGFFSCVQNATLTGIHLRHVLINFAPGTHTDCGSLCVYASGNTTISLCSATGDITFYGNSTRNHSGGLIGGTADATMVTRCSCNVNITAADADSYQCVGGFVGSGGGTSIFAGCSSDAVMSFKDDYSCKVGGFVGKTENGPANIIFFGCSAKGRIVQGDSFAFIGQRSTESAMPFFLSCYSTIDTKTFAGSAAIYTDCAWTGTQSESLPGVTYSVAVADLYATLTASGTFSPDAVKTLHWSKADGYTLTEVSDTWDALSVWKDNGSAVPTVDMAYEGGVFYNGQPANLLALAGQTAYYVTPVDVLGKTLWASISFTTVCPDGWHVPTKEDLMKMTGGLPGITYTEHFDAINSVFPEGLIYWTPDTDMENTANAWALYIAANQWQITSYFKENTFCVRCVREKP